MLLRKIFLNNFFVHENTTIDFTKTDGVVLIEGPNGSGKSSIIEGICYAIFNELRTNNIDDAIRHGSDSMYVVVEFELNGQLIRIARSKRRGKPQKLELSVDDVIIEELASEVQKRINSIVKLSSESFRSSIFFKQEDGNFFASASPVERQQILSDLLELNKYERLEKIARDSRTEVKNTIKAKQISIQDMEDINIPELESMLIKLKKVCDKNEIKIAELELKLQELNAFNTIVLEQERNKQSIILKNSKLQERIANNQLTIKNNIAKLSEIKEILSTKEEYDVVALQKKLTEYSDILDNQNNLIENLKEETQKIVSELKEKHVALEKPIRIQLHEIQANKNHASKQIKQLSSLDSSECPTCLRDLNKKEVSDMILSLEKEIKKYISEIEVVENKLYTSEENLRLSIADINNKSFKDLETLQEEKLKIQNNKSKLKNKIQEVIDEEKKLSQFIQKKASLEEKNLTLQDEIVFLEGQFEDVPNIEISLKDDKEIKSNLLEAKENQKNALTIQISKEKQIEIAKQNEDKKKRIMSEVQELHSELELLENLVVAFSKSGIPASIIANILPTIEDNANEYLEKLTDKDFTIQFNTTSENKKGDVKNTLDIAINSGGNIYNFNNLSGGEKFVISLALRLALAKVLTQRANVKLETLIIDEGATAADAQVRQNFVGVIKSLKNIYPRIILTTHLQDIAESFDNRITLNGKNNEST